MSNEVWEANISNVNRNDFEESRRCLLTAYHSYVQNHAGYLIAVIIGLIALFTSSSSFFRFGSLAFVISLGLITALIIYVLIRMEFWTSYANQAITLGFELSIYNFNKLNSESPSPYTNKFPAPESAILQIAAYCQLKFLAENPKTPLRKRILFIIINKIHI